MTINESIDRDTRSEEYRRRPDKDKHPRYSANRQPIACVDCGAMLDPGAARIWRTRSGWKGAHRDRYDCYSERRNAGRSGPVKTIVVPAEARTPEDDDVLGIWS